MSALGQDGPTDLEGAGPGGGADVVHEREAEPRPGSRVGLVVTLIFVALALLVPVLWAVGVYARIALIPGVGPAAAAGYFLLATLVIAAAALFIWAQLRESA